MTSLEVSAFCLYITFHILQSTFHGLPVVRALALHEVRCLVSPTIWFGAGHDSCHTVAARKVSSCFHDRTGIDYLKLCRPNLRNK